MPYLTYDEYLSFGFEEIRQDEFDKLLPKASDVVDSVTRSFYEFNDINDDVEFRRNRFKKAVAAQIQYFHDLGGTMMHQINTPLTVQIGRTQMLTGERNQQRSNKIVSEDALMYLQGTDLLYRGLAVKS